MSILDRFRRNRTRSPYLSPAEQAAVYARVARRQEEFLLGIGRSPEDARRIADARARRQSVIRPEIAQRIDAAGDAAMERAERERRSGVAAYRRAVKEECARTGVSEADFYRAEPGLLAMAWPSVHERLAHQEPVFDLDAEDAYEHAESQYQAELHGLPDPQANPVPASSDSPAGQTSAADRLRNRDVAEDAIQEFQQQVSMLGDYQAALRAVLDQQDPENVLIAGEAVVMFQGSRMAGDHPDLAWSTGVDSVADRPRRDHVDADTAAGQTESLMQIMTDLFRDPGEAEQPDVDGRHTATPGTGSSDASGIESMTAAQAREIVLRAEELSTHLETCSLSADDCPTCRENILDEDRFWDRKVGEARARLADYSVEDIITGRFTGADREDAVPERDPEPGSWIGRNLPARDAEAGREWLPRVMGLARAEDILARAEEASAHLRECPVPSHECRTCTAYLPRNTRFWLTEVPEARRVVDSFGGREVQRAAGDGDPIAAGDPFWAAAAEEVGGEAELDRSLRELMTDDEARDTILRAERLRGHIETCATPAGECTTCSDYDPAVSDFWEVEVAAAESRLASRAAGDVILVDADRGEVVVVNSHQTAAEAADRIVGEPDVNDADWSRNPPAPSPVPEREPEPGSWIARNLTPGDGERVPLVDGEQVYAEDVLARLARLGDGPVTEEALASAGLDPAELHSFRREQLPAAAREFLTAQHEREVAEEASEHERERREAAEALTVARAREILAQAAELTAHTDGCRTPVEHCPTCSAEERGDDPNFWDNVTAARDRLAGLSPEQIAAQAADDTADDAAEHADISSGGTDRASAVSGADTVLDRIDEVLAEPEPPRLTDTARECDQALAEAETAVQRARTSDEDDARDERCARWNTDDACTETADCDRDCDGDER